VRRLHRHLFFLLLAAAFTLVASRPAYATAFTFAGTSAGGTGSAEMAIDIDVVNNVLTLTLSNTSPTVLNSGTGANAPGITAFGFDLLNNPLPSLLSWSLTADQYVSGAFQTVTVGSSAGSSYDWTMGTFKAGVEMDYLPQNKGMDGALLNPDALGSPLLPGGKNSVYYTDAILTMKFSSTPILDISSTSPFVRFQNVGAGGEGSLKLSAVPEPATLALLATGAFIAYRGRRRSR
jgi:hypothetical protein